MDLDKTLKVSLAALQSFILSVRAKMVDNAYHNWRHAVDVTQVTLPHSLQSYCTGSTDAVRGCFLTSMITDGIQPGYTERSDGGAVASRANGPLPRRSLPRPRAPGSHYHNAFLASFLPFPLILEEFASLNHIARIVDINCEHE